MTASQGPFWTYVLENPDGRRYVGSTNDLARRLAEHNNPSHNVRKHTSRNPGPWELVHQEQFKIRSEALQRERWLKSGKGREWLDSLIGRASSPRAD